MSIAAYQGVCPTCRHDHSADSLAPTTRETADRETLVMQSIIDAHGQWEIENRNRKQGEGQLWQDGHVRLLAQAAIIAADHIGEANEKVTDDHAELAVDDDDDDDDCETCDGAGEVEARIGFGTDYIPCPDCVSRDHKAEKAALLSEIAALRGEVERSLPSISRDGEHAISDHRRWLARQLLDSKLDDGEAYGIVAYHPAITDLRTTQAERQRDELRKALEFYANPEIYKPHPHGLAFDDRDVSFRAKSVLANHGPDQ